MLCMLCVLMPQIIPLLTLALVCNFVLYMVLPPSQYDCPRSNSCWFCRCWNLLAHQIAWQKFVHQRNQQTFDLGLGSGLVINNWLIKKFKNPPFKTNFFNVKATTKVIRIFSQRGTKPWVWSTPFKELVSSYWSLLWNLGETFGTSSIHLSNFKRILGSKIGLCAWELPSWIPY